MSEHRSLAVALMTELRAAGPSSPAESLSALVSCLIVTINSLSDEEARARVTITALQAIISNVDAPSALLSKLSKEVALADVAGTA